MADRILFLETPDIQKTPVGEKNEYTAAEKQKLAGIEAGAQKNTVDSVNGKTGPVTLDASDVGALPSNTPIPAAVTEQTVSGWGFTKNTGTYSKPSGGIPASDLASAVQTSLGKADTALQSAPVTSVNNKIGAVVLGASDVHALPDSTVIPPTVTEQTVAGWGFTKNTGTYVKPSTGIPASDLASGVQTSLGKADTALQSHQSLAAYRTATAQDTIDAAQDQAISGKLSTTGNAYRSASIPMGHLDSTSTATVMTATVDGITELRDGVCMWLRNGVITSASGFTLNVNGLGAKPCYSSLAAASRSTTIFNVNYTMLFVYNSTRVDGGCWDIVYGVDTNTTYTPVKLGFGYGTCTTAAATAAKTASISSYALTTGGIVSIKFDNDVPSGATLNISSKGAKAIYHRGAAITAGVIKAGDTATFVYSTYYHLIAIDRDEQGGALPAVTAADNDKPLLVKNGAWAAGAKPLIIPVVETSPGSNKYEIDSSFSMTSAELFEAVKANYASGNILLEVPIEGSTKEIYPLTYFDINDAPVDWYASLSFITTEGGTELNYRVEVYPDQDITVYFEQTINLIRPTGGQVGDFLVRDQSGNGRWVTIPAAEGSAF